MKNSGIQAPVNLGELQQLVSSIYNKTADIKLGKRSLEALMTLLNMPERAAFESINQLGKRLEISPSTLSRSTTRLGFEGFNDLQKLFRDSLTEPSHFYSDKAVRLEQVSNVATTSACQELLFKVANEEIRNIQKMVASVAPGDIHNAIELLNNANTIKTFAQRQFYSLATFFSYCLGLLRDQVGVLGESGHGAPHALAQMNTDDLLVVFGSYPYSRITVESCRQAQLMNIPTLIFSDSHGAPLNDGSQALFTLPTDGSFYSNSSGAWVVIIEAILTAYAQSLGAEAIKKLEQREQLFDNMQVTYKP